MSAVALCLLISVGMPAPDPVEDSRPVQETVLMGTAAFLTALTVSLTWASAFSLTQLESVPLAAVTAGLAACVWIVSVALFAAAFRYAAPHIPSTAPPWDARRSRQRTLGFLILLMGPATAAGAFFSMIAYGVISILAPVAGMGRPFSQLTTWPNLACCGLQVFALCLLPIPVAATTLAGAKMIDAAETL